MVGNECEQDEERRPNSTTAVLPVILFPLYASIGVQIPINKIFKKRL